MRADIRAMVRSPRHVGIGAYRALLRARLAHAIQEKVELVTTHAREQSSAPILDRFGFETVCRFTVLRSP